MCWSVSATYAMVGLGTAATVLAWRRGEPAAIWGTLGYFTGMEMLQVAGYAVIDRCDSLVNTALTQIAYLHIAFQPLVINAFVLALMGAAVPPRVRTRVFALAGLASALMLARMIPADWAGTCPIGSALCGSRYCTVSGHWHLAWEMALNDLGGWVSGTRHLLTADPEYLLAAFALPAFYGGWRFSVFQVSCGLIPVVTLVNNPNEAPAVWCLFSVGLLLVALSPALRRQVAPQAVAA
jgi:hypothetical protein